MNFIPKPKSKKWLIFALVLFSINVGALLGAFYIQGTIPDSNILPLSILSLVVTLIATGGGYAGGKIFILISMPFHFFGLIFMLSIASTASSSGFEMLSAFIMYLFATVVGFVLGFIVQLVIHYRKKK
jgi:predicted DNA repair protein MutK